MKKKKLILFILLTAFSAGLQAQSLVVIVNSANSTDNLSFKQLKKIYTAAKQKWDNGKKIKLSVLNIQSEAGKKFLDKVYGMPAQEYKKFWLQKVFRGEAKAPVKKNTAQAVVDFVSGKPGAIGFVPQGTALNGVKTLKIDGKNSGEKGYPLP